MANLEMQHFLPRLSIWYLLHAAHAAESLGSIELASPARATNDSSRYSDATGVMGYGEIVQMNVIHWLH